MIMHHYLILSLIILIHFHPYMGIGDHSFHFIPDQDGLISQYLQVENLLSVLNSYNRSKLVIYPFTSLHFNNSDPTGISLCDVFIMNQNITCKVLNIWEYRQLIIEQICIFLGPHKLTDFPFVAQTNLLIKSTKKYDFQTGTCVIGSAWKWNGFRPATTSSSSYSVHSPQGIVRFQPKYLHLLHHALTILQVIPSYNIAAKLKKSLAVFHWRRGDQLYTRCEWKNQFVDTSVNCKSADVFMLEAHKELEKRGLHLKDVVIYVATNEQDPHILNTLSNGHFHHFNASLLTGLQHLNSPKLKLTQLDIYVIEILLMSSADLFVSIGRSNANLFIKRIRAQKNADSVIRQLEQYSSVSVGIK